MTEVVQLVGFSELEKELENLTKAVGKGVLRRALKTAAMPMAEIARALAPDDRSTGGYDLKKSIAVSTRLSRSEKKKHRKMFRDDKASVEMFVGAGPLPQAIFTEFGTSPFINKGLFAGSQNPGIPPQPFMRPAWDADGKALLDRLGQELWSELEKATARAARRAERQARG